jgi:hypothetical protein
MRQSDGGNKELTLQQCTSLSEPTANGSKDIKRIFV